MLKSKFSQGLFNKVNKYKILLVINFRNCIDQTDYKKQNAIFSVKLVVNKYPVNLY